MANQLNINKKIISPIENKIREFQTGVDYVFEEEKYHAPHTVGEKKHGTMDIRGYTHRYYKILSPELRKTLQEMLTKRAVILMSFDFKGDGTVNEHFRYNDVPNSYYCQTDDEFGYQIVLQDERANEPAQLSIWDTERTEKEKRKYAEHYQVAKQCYEEKKQKNSQESSFNIPPQGTKCWRCDKVISSSDISQGRYRVFNHRIFGMIHKIFEHLKEDNCPAQDSKKERGFDHFMYFPKLTKKWEKLSKSEWLCRNALEEVHTEMTYNLTYLESLKKAPWNEFRDEDILLTKKNIAEVEERLEKIKQEGRYNDCDINCADCGNILCYHEKGRQDCPAGSRHKSCHGNMYQRGEKNNKTNQPIEGNKNLLSGSNSNHTPNNNQINEVERNQIKQYFETWNIHSIALEGDNLVIVYNDNNKGQEVVKVNNRQLQLIKSVVKKQPGQSLSFSELQNNNNSSPNSRNNNLYQVLAIGIVSGIILIGLVLVLTNKKKTSRKVN
jgi:hypothetical protein